MSKAEQKLLWATEDIVLALLELESEHIRCSYMPGMPLDHGLEEVGLRYWRDLKFWGDWGSSSGRRAYGVKAASRPQVSIEVNRILSVVVYSSYLQKNIIIQNQKHDM